MVDTATHRVFANIRILDHDPGRLLGEDEGIIGYGFPKVGDTLEDWFEQDFPGIKRIDVQLHLTKPIVDEAVMRGLKQMIVALLPMMNRCEFYLDVAMRSEVCPIDSELNSWQTGETYRIIKDMFISEGNRKCSEAGGQDIREARVTRDDSNLWGWGRSAEIISWLDVTPR